MTIQQQQADLLQQQIRELIRVGVGGKHKNDKDYTTQIQEELELEDTHMLREGLKKYKKRQEAAVEKSQESTTLYGLQYQAKYISKLSVLINDDVVKMLGGNSGRHRTSFRLICQCLSELAFNEQVYIKNPSNWDAVSLIVLKNVINGISRNHTLNRLSIAIGTALELEARLTYFQDKDRETFTRLSKKLNKGIGLPQKKSKYLYKKNVFIYWMNRKELVWEKWDKESKLHIGTELIHYCEKLGLIRVVLVRKGKNKSIYYVNSTPKLLREIKDFNTMNEAMYPDFLPMIMPPLDWNRSPFRGGYYAKKYNQENTVAEVKSIVTKNKKENN